jgi:hypothetical protein
VLLDQPGAGCVEAAIEDHIHHFSVTITHDGVVVTGVEGTAIRAPWDLCAGAVAVLAELVGSPIGARPNAGDPSRHCTHLLDLAATAIRFAGDPAPASRIDLEVRGWSTDRCTAGAVRSDGTALHWLVEDGTIRAPEQFAGRALGRGFTRFTAALDAGTAELALLLRRAVLMRRARGIDLDRFDVLAESGVAPGTCFASRSDRIHLARRNRGSSLPELP